MAKVRKPLRCGKCGHKIGTVRVKPAFQRKLLVIGFAVVFAFELVSNFVTNLILNRLGL